ncbi:MAG: hypothetical protein HYY06_27580 [Deltaproteobacteria bacterium]|nr:hypothetical protein [Deltaproteobacteria bacterium]
MKIVTTCFLLVAAGLGGTSCASFHLRTATGFVELEDQDDYDLRATSAEGVVVSVRKMPNRPRGSLAFWTGAVDERLQREGYAPVSLRAVRTESGLAGRQIRYERVRSGVTYHYWVTVFVTEGGFLSRSRVFLVEAGGDQFTFPQAERDVERTIRSFRA